MTQNQKMPQDSKPTVQGNQKQNSQNHNPGNHNVMRPDENSDAQKKSESNPDKREQRSPDTLNKPTPAGDRNTPQEQGKQGR